MISGGKMRSLTVPPSVLRITNRLQEGKRPLYAIIFNFIDSRYFNVFAIVDGNWVTVYQCLEGGVIAVLQSYIDEDITAFSDRHAEFEKLNTEVLGVSVDSVFSHLAWIQTDRKSGGLGDLKYPLISDVTKSISKSYGVLIPDQAKH